MIIKHSLSTLQFDYVLSARKITPATRSTLRKIRYGVDVTLLEALGAVVDGLAVEATRQGQSTMRRVGVEAYRTLWQDILSTPVSESPSGLAEEQRAMTLALLDRERSQRRQAERDAEEERSKRVEVEAETRSLRADAEKWRALQNLLQS